MASRRTGSATLAIRTLPFQWDAAIGRAIATTPLTVRIDLEDTGGTRPGTHNHAAHCLLVRDGRVAEWWMVEALPAESEAFWVFVAAWAAARRPARAVGDRPGAVRVRPCPPR